MHLERGDTVTLVTGASAPALVMSSGFWCPVGGCPRMAEPIADGAMSEEGWTTYGDDDES